MTDSHVEKEVYDVVPTIVRQALSAVLPSCGN